MLHVNLEVLAAGEPDLKIQPGAKIQTDGAVTQNGLEVRISRQESFCEYHLTGLASGPGSLTDRAKTLFDGIAGEIATRKIQPIQEKLYGLTSVKTTVLRLRADACRRNGLDPELPVTWVEGAPVHGPDFAGVQLWGVAARDEEVAVRTVANPVTGPGRCWTGPGFRMIYLPQVRGSNPGGALIPGRRQQAEQMFANAGAGLKAHGFSCRNIVRTWIYVARLLDWYGELNRIRTEYFRTEGLVLEAGSAFPASTGIQGKHLDEECFMDVLALEPDRPGRVTAEAMRRSSRQNQPSAYGSAFSRGMTLDIEGRQTVHISGTASINADGATMHTGNAEGQCRETMLNVGAILEQRRGSLENIVMATLFCKNRETFDAWQQVSRLLRVPEFPTICVLADICRPELLVELEAVAVI